MYRDMQKREKQIEELEAIERGNPDYRCLDEAWLHFYGNHGASGSIKVELDSWKHRDHFLYGTFVSDLPDTLRTPQQLVYRIGSYYVMPDVCSASRSPMGGGQGKALSPRECPFQGR